MVPTGAGGRVRPTGAPRCHQFSQRVIRRGKRRSALFALAVNNEDWVRARKIGAGIGAFWRRIIDDLKAFPPESWQLFFQSNLTGLGKKCRPVCVGMTWRRLIPAGPCGSGDHDWRRSTAKRDSLESEYEGGWNR